jgi:hypothetical protein
MHDHSSPNIARVTIFSITWACMTNKCIQTYYWQTSLETPGLDAMTTVKAVLREEITSRYVGIHLDELRRVSGCP